MSPAIKKKRWRLIRRLMRELCILDPGGSIIQRFNLPRDFATCNTLCLMIRPGILLRVRSVHVRCITHGHARINIRALYYARALWLMQKGKKKRKVMDSRFVEWEFPIKNNAAAPPSRTALSRVVPPLVNLMPHFIACRGRSLELDVILRRWIHPP